MSGFLCFYVSFETPLRQAQRLLRMSGKLVNAFPAPQDKRYLVNPFPLILRRD